jgi:peptidoglycan/LPS O-acetylase OafA/YrhL
VRSRQGWRTEYHPISGCLLPLAALLAVTLWYFAAKDAVWFGAVAGLFVAVVLTVTGWFLRRTTDPAKHRLGAIVLLAAAVILVAALLVDVKDVTSTSFCGVQCR